MVRKVSKNAKAKGVIKKAMKRSPAKPKSSKISTTEVVETDIQDNTEYEVESIKGSKKKDEQLFYQVKWRGYKKLSWEPETNLKGCQELLEEFLQKGAAKNKKRSKKRS